MPPDLGDPAVGLGLGVGLALCLHLAAAWIARLAEGHSGKKKGGPVSRTASISSPCGPCQ